MENNKKCDARKGEAVVGLMLESPRQAMGIIKGFVTLIGVTADACAFVKGKIESGDPEEIKKATEILGLMTNNLQYKMVDILAEHAEKVPEERLTEILDGKTGEPRITPATKCAGNA